MARPPQLQVDATAETALAARFGISAYPTLKVFRKGGLASLPFESNRPHLTHVFDHLPPRCMCIAFSPCCCALHAGKAFPYDGPRERNGIVDEMLDLSLPPAKKLETVFDTDSIIDGEDPVVIGFFDRCFMS